MLRRAGPRHGAADDAAMMLVDDGKLPLFMVMSPTQGGRIQLNLKLMIYEAMGRDLRKD